MALQNSKECEWSDASIFLNGARITKVSGWDYRPVRDKQFLHAAGDEPHSIQRGQKSYTGNLQLFKNAIDEIRRAVQAAGGEDLTDATFLVVLNYAQKGQRILQTDTLFGLEFTEDPRSMNNTTLNGAQTVPIMFTKIKSA